MAAVYAAERPQRSWILAGGCSGVLGVTALMVLATMRLAIPDLVTPWVGWGTLAIGGAGVIAGAGLLVWQWRANDARWRERLRLLEARAMPVPLSPPLLAPESLRAVTAQIHEIVELATTCTGILETAAHRDARDRSVAPGSPPLDPV